MKLSYHHTEEAKAKISVASKNRVRRRGYHLTDETKAKISRALKGRIRSEEERAKYIGHPVSEETKAKISRALKGKTRPAMKGNKHALGYRFTKEQKANLSRARMGHIVTEETRAKIGSRMFGNKRGFGNRSNTGRVLSPETRLKISLAGRGREDTPEVKAKKSQARIGMKFGPEHRANIGKSKKIAWSNPEWRDKVVKAQRLGCHVHPNRPETMILEILGRMYPDEWAFVGDGSLVIGGKNPDFANINGQKKLIEFFGDYWHRGQNPQNRIKLFAKYGFKTLVIWERELEDISKVCKKIAKFAGAPNLDAKRR